MNALQSLPTQAWVQQLGWTLVQFLWQGTLLAMLFALVRGILRRRVTAHARYLLACGTLGLMVMAPGLTFLARVSVPPVPAWPVPSPQVWRSVLPWLVAAWLSGVVVFSARLIGGWRVTARLRSMGVHPAHLEWQRKLEHLIDRVGVSRPVRLLVSSLVEVPVVVGWWRPVILVPVGALTGLPPAHVEALLAHELAHIRRGDYLMNVLQSLAEAALFYHPAVWWVSSQIRAERELCCDDLAVAASGDVLTYARALAELESRRPAHRHALAASGGSLLDRIRRLLGHAPPTSYAFPGPGAAGTMSLLWLLGLGAVGTHAAPRPLPSPLPMRQSPSSEWSTTAPRPMLSTLLFGPLGPAVELHPRSTQVPSAGVQTKTARVEGRMVSASGGAVPRATVQLLGSTGNIIQTSDDEGKFVFDDVPPGRYVLEGAKVGFITDAFGAPAPGAPAPSITLEAGMVLKNAVIKLTPQGVVAGQVTNQDGDPVARLNVTIYRTDYVRGHRQLIRAASAATDDEGHYRIANLTPGRYYLGVAAAAGTTGGRGGAPAPVQPSQSNGTGSASTGGFTTAVRAAQFGTTPLVLPSDPAAAFAAGLATGAVASGAAFAKPNKDGLADVATFYPNGSDIASASALDITPGARLESMDIHLHRERVFSVKGSVTVNGATTASAVVQAERIDNGLVLQVVAGIARQGTFEIANLPPGTYVLRVPGLGGRFEVTIGTSDVDGVMVAAEAGVAVTGIFRLEEGDFQSARKMAADFQPRLRLIPEDAATPGTALVVKEDGSFTALGATAAGRYLLEIAGLPAGTYMKSIRYSGQDVTQAPLDLAGDGGKLEVTLSTTSSGVSGSLRDAKGEPRGGVTVTIWPKRLNLWSSTLGARSVTTDQNGRFQVAGVPPGDYYAAGWEGEPLNSDVIQSSEFLAHLAADAAAVTVGESSQVTVNAKLISAARIAAEVAKLR